MKSFVTTALLVSSLTALAQNSGTGPGNNTVKCEYSRVEAYGKYSYVHHREAGEMLKSANCNFNPESKLIAHINYQIKDSIPSPLIVPEAALLYATGHSFLKETYTLNVVDEKGISQQKIVRLGYQLAFKDTSSTYRTKKDKISYNSETMDVDFVNFDEMKNLERMADSGNAGYGIRINDKEVLFRSDFDEKNNFFSRRLVKEVGTVINEDFDFSVGQEVKTFQGTGKIREMFSNDTFLVELDKKEFRETALSPREWLFVPVDCFRNICVGETVVGNSVTKEEGIVRKVWSNKAGAKYSGIGVYEIEFLDSGDRIATDFVTKIK